MKAARFAICIILAAAPRAFAGGPKATPASHTVDAGTFGVFVNGRRVATEKFDIQQRADGSTVNSELKMEDGAVKVDVASQMQLSPAGALIRYNLRELSPGNTQAVVEPSAEFVIEHVTEKSQKPQEVPFMVPPTTLIVDDFFFTHREVLAWRYLASACQTKDGALRCSGAKTQFGVLVPRQRTTQTLTLEIGGRDHVQLKGADRELTRLDLHNEDESWSIWVDDQLRVQRITIPSQNTEVVRD